MPESIGQQLLKARKERGIAIEQASRALHIRPAYLEALENDRRDDLPSPVQGKGFLRLYADYLGLPVGLLLNAWDGKIAPPTTELIHPEDAAVSPTEQLSAGSSTNAVSPPEPQAILMEEVPADKTTATAPVEAAPPANTPSRETFRALGITLYSRRQALGLSLDEVERYTHVRHHYLQALEEGRIGDLPSPVQGRGMLSNYAHFLNLDHEAVLLQFASGLQNQRIERLENTQEAGGKTQPARQPAQKKPIARPLFSPNLLLGSLLILIIIGFGLWTAAQVDALQKKNSISSPPSIADVLLNTPIVTATIAVSPTAAANLNTLAPGEVSAGKPQSSQAAPATTITVPVSGTAPIQVYVVASQRAYLRITTDSKIAFDSRTIPGNAYQFSGERKIELLTGNAGGIQVYFNQKDLGVLGLVGQVKSLVFTKDGAVTPTPQFTVTPTRTLQPSSTLRPSPTAPTATITPFIP